MEQMHAKLLKTCNDLVWIINLLKGKVQRQLIVLENRSLKTLPGVISLNLWGHLVMHNYKYLNNIYQAKVIDNHLQSRPDTEHQASRNS